MTINDSITVGLLVCYGLAAVWAVGWLFRPTPQDPTDPSRLRHHQDDDQEGGC